MDRTWKLAVWGVRGSFPRPSPECAEYGGNTVCTALEYEEHTVILDAGTGLAPLGQALTARKKAGRLDILLSHFHIDHVLGLYSFPPFFDSGMKIHLYGGAGLERHLKTLIAPPFWPLEICTFPAKVAFHEIQPGERFGLNGLTVSTRAGNHPGGSLLYRLEGGGKRLTYALDCEAGGPVFPSLAEFARESDLLIWDASFTPQDLRPGWGHSTWEQGLALGRAAQVKQVLMSHYSWDYSDECLRRQERLARPDGICRFAREGMVMTL